MVKTMTGSPHDGSTHCPSLFHSGGSVGAVTFRAIILAKAMLILLLRPSPPKGQSPGLCRGRYFDIGFTRPANDSEKHRCSNPNEESSPTAEPRRKFVREDINRKIVKPDGQK